MLDAWPVSRRIGSGFVLLTGLVIAVSLFSQKAVGNLGAGYVEYRGISQQAMSLNAYFEDFSEAQLAAVAYWSEPSAPLREDVFSNISELTNDPTLLNPFETTPERLMQVEGIIAQAVGYGASFRLMSDRLQSALVLETDFDTETAAFKSEINSIFSATVRTGTPATISAAGQSLQSAMAAIVQAKQFKLTNAPQDLTAFMSLYSDFERNFRRLSALNGQDAITRQITQLEARLQGFAEKLTAFSEMRQSAFDLKTTLLDQEGPEILNEFDVLLDDIAARQSEIGPKGDAILRNLQMVIPAAGVVATLLAIVLAFGIGRWVTRAISRLADTTDALAGGDNDIVIGGTEHRHELGRMARALEVFRQAQRDRIAIDAENARLQERQNTVVATMKDELASVAEGDLTRNITVVFSADYEALRENFNTAISALHAAIQRVNDTTGMIGQTTAQSTAATNELSQRTENQAATLEQTAAALDELTASVKSAAEHAKSVDNSVNRARTEATKNGEIVAQAVSAMSAIEQSSKQISQVIGVIDDIAFQTNLLALNAGVEAARAGESGKGFAVVASEVRALAQRSAEAAKEISGLIASSSRHVEHGTALVGNAGDALGEIITQVNDISSMTSQIATSAQEQAIGLSEINIGVNQLDQVTQQNAAMVQDQMMRGELLSSETQKLSNLVKHFRVSDASGTNGQSYGGAAAFETAISDSPTGEPEKTREDESPDPAAQMNWRSA